MYDDGVGLPFQSQPDLIGDKYVKYLDLLDLGVDILKPGLLDWEEAMTGNKYNFIESSLYSFNKIWVLMCVFPAFLYTKYSFYKLSFKCIGPYITEVWSFVLVI